MMCGLFEKQESGLKDKASGFIAFCYCTEFQIKDEGFEYSLEFLFSLHNNNK